MRKNAHVPDVYELVQNCEIPRPEVICRDTIVISYQGRFFGEMENKHANPTKAPEVVSKATTDCDELIVEYTDYLI